VALSAFWLTKVPAINTAFFSLFTFLGGQFAPLDVLPTWMQTVAAWTPFPWTLAFPVEVLPLGLRHRPGQRGHQPATQVLGLSVIFTNTAELRGRTADDLLILIGIHFFISGLVGLVVRPSFWFVKLDNILVIFQALFGNAGRWPVTIFPGWMRPVLTFVVPIAFAVTVPAQALTGQLPGVTALLAVGVAVLFLAGSRVFWLVALRRYTGASA